MLFPFFVGLMPVHPTSLANATAIMALLPNRATSIALTLVESAPCLVLFARFNFFGSLFCSCLFHVIPFVKTDTINSQDKCQLIEWYVVKNEKM